MGCQQSKAQQEHAVSTSDSKFSTKDTPSNNAKGSVAPTTSKKTANDVTQGTGFVEAEINVPRHAWVVIFINDKKVGKMVMQLKGKGVSVAVKGDFEELYKGAVVDKASMSVTEVEPKLYLTTQMKKDYDNKPDVYGVIEDGAEVMDAIKNADGEAHIIIKQAALFPVKKSKAST